MLLTPTRLRLHRPTAATAENLRRAVVALEDDPQAAQHQGHGHQEGVGDGRIADGHLVRPEELQHGPPGPPPDEEQAEERARPPLVAVAAVEGHQDDEAQQQPDRLVEEGRVEARVQRELGQVGVLRQAVVGVDEDAPRPRRRRAI